MLHRTYESFNNSIKVRDAAWLYFLAYIYGGKLSIKSWKNDKRMGVNADEAFKNFERTGEVIITEDQYLSTNDAFDTIHKFFATKSLKEAFDKAIELESYKVKDSLYDYPVNKIPIDLYIKSNDKIDSAIEEWHDYFFVTWWNTNGSDSVINKWIKRVGSDIVDKVNEYHLRNYFYPNQLPEEITLYRGIKKDFDPKHKKKYTSWTISEEQGKRFAKYHFSQGYTSRPTESDKQVLLETKVKLEDIVVFVGGEEHEVILKEPVEIDKIRKLK